MRTNNHNLKQHVDSHHDTIITFTVIMSHYYPASGRDTCFPPTRCRRAWRSLPPPTLSSARSATSHFICNSQTSTRCIHVSNIAYNIPILSASTETKLILPVLVDNTEHKTYPYCARVQKLNYFSHTLGQYRKQNIPILCASTETKLIYPYSWTIQKTKHTNIVREYRN